MGFHVVLDPATLTRFDAELRARFPEEGPARLAADFGCSLDYVRGRAKYLKVKSLNKGRFISQAMSGRTNSVNHHYFDTWSPNMAWLLGYILTDGHIGTVLGKPYYVAFQCAEEDAGILEAIRTEMQSSHKIASSPAFDFVGANGKTYRAQRPFRLRICSSVLTRTLVDRFGIVPRKTYLDPEMPDVPDDLLCHFLRGVIDGDGSIYQQKQRDGELRAGIGITGGRKLLSGLVARVYASIGVTCRSPRELAHCKVAVAVSWTARGDVQKLLSFMYPTGAYLHLQRKRIVADRILLDIQGRPPVHSPKITPLSDAELEALRSTHGSWAEVGRALGVHPVSVSRAVRRRKLKA